MIAVPSSLYVNQRLGDTRAIYQRPEAFPFGLSLPVLSLSKGRRPNGMDVRPVETPVSGYGAGAEFQSDAYLRRAPGTGLER